MNRIKHTNCTTLAILALLALPACATTVSTPPATTVASLNYEVPASVDVKTIIDSLEQSSAEVLKRPVTVDESTSATSTGKPTNPIVLRERVVYLEGLGKVAIPSINCPGAYASMHSLLPSKTGLRLIAGCVVEHDGATRVYLAEAATGDPTLFSLSREVAEPIRLSEIGKGLVRRLPEAYAIETSNVPVERISNRSGPAETTSADSLPHSEETAATGPSDVEIHASPLVCFSPKQGSTVVRDHPGGTMVGTLSSDLIVQKEDPSKNSFLRVTTQEGRAGWIKRSEVRWTPCPVA